MPSPDGEYAYAGNYMALSRWSKSGTENGSINPWPENSMGWPARPPERRFPVDRADRALRRLTPTRSTTAAKPCTKSTDRGTHWTKISRDLTRNDKSKQQSSGGPITQDNTSAEGDR